MCLYRTEKNIQKSHSKSKIKQPSFFFFFFFQEVLMFDHEQGMSQTIKLSQFKTINIKSLA